MQSSAQMPIPMYKNKRDQLGALLTKQGGYDILIYLIGKIMHPKINHAQR